MILTTEVKINDTINLGSTLTLRTKRKSMMLSKIALQLQLHKEVKYDVQNAICAAKSAYTKQLEEQFKLSDAKSVWHRLQTVTGYEQTICTSVNDNKHMNSDNMNEFYCQFDRDNANFVTMFPSQTSLAQPFMVQVKEVQNLFTKQNIHKAPGPNGIYTLTFHYCAE